VDCCAKDWAICLLEAAADLQRRSEVMKKCWVRGCKKESWILAFTGIRFLNYCRDHFYKSKFKGKSK